MSDWCWPHQDTMAVVRLHSVHHDRQSCSSCYVDGSDI
jgi:hypothetical protein